MNLLPTRKRLMGSWIAAFLLAFFIAAGGVFAAISGGHGGFPLFITACAFFICVLPYSALLTTSFARDVRCFLQERSAAIFIFPAIFVGTYVLYALGTGCFDWLALIKLFLFLFIPTSLILLTNKLPILSNWIDFFVITLIWLPFDLGWLASIWKWPEGEGAYVINTAMAIVLASTLFVGARHLDRVQLRFALNRRELSVVMFCLLGFLIFAIPFGFITDFIGWNVKPLDAKILVGTPLGILFFIAVPEELLFRGLVQNLLTKVMKSKIKGLVVAALFFGMTHLNNEPTLDWRYLILSTVAGLFYGSAYLRCRSLLAPALVHMLVDTLWVLFFLKS